MANHDIPDGAFDTPTMRRRGFFLWIAEVAAWMVTILLAIPLVRFVLYPVVAKASESDWSNLGATDQFASATTPSLVFLDIPQKDGWLESVSRKAVYITKDKQGNLEALTAVCPHLGCTVQWAAEKNQFLCPCHGSIFSPDGSHVAGPAARGMDSLPLSVENGQLKVRYENYRQLQATKEVSS